MTRVRKQPIIDSELYFEFTTVLKFYNLEAWCPAKSTSWHVRPANIRISLRIRSMGSQWSKVS